MMRDGPYALTPSVTVEERTLEDVLLEPSVHRGGMGPMKASKK